MSDHAHNQYELRFAIEPGEKDGCAEPCCASETATSTRTDSIDENRRGVTGRAT